MLQRLLAGDDLRARTARPLAWWRAHPRLDLAQVVGRERARQVDVVVEAVLDGRTDGELGVREDLLDRLGHQVRGGVAHPRQLVGRAGLGFDRDVHLRHFFGERCFGHGVLLWSISRIASSGCRLA